MPKLVIEVEFADASDLDFAREKVIGAAEEKLYDLEDEGRFDAGWTVNWDIED